MFFINFKKHLFKKVGQLYIRCSECQLRYTVYIESKEYLYFNYIMDSLEVVKEGCLSHISTQKY